MTYMELLFANTEAAVDKIIKNHPHMKDSRNWHPVDERDTNLNTIGNLSQTGGKAATELITNMVDAMLTKYCKERGIDPKSKNAPKTMYDAVDKFVMPLNGGKIIRADDDKKLLKYAEKNLIIGIVGSKSGKVRPCYVFCDNGEGQHPKDFTNTFLSLKAKNKSQIPFVQGQYNMGSSGVLMFCGDMGYKLIISRCYDKTGKWGWTLIRINQSGDDSYAEYYAPNRKIETAGMERMFPFKLGDDSHFDGFSLETGTIIKLYEYHTGKRHSGFRGAREAFNENLVETILPLRILDFRHKPEPDRGELRSKGIDPRPLYGLEYYIVRSHAEDRGENDVPIVDESEKIIHISTIQDTRLGEIIITAIKLKKSIGNKGIDSVIQGRIFHHVNGQVQFKCMRGFLTQCKLPALKDRVVIFVDSSKLTSHARTKIWKGDRENIKETEKGELYKDKVKNAITNSPELKSLNYQIAREEIAAASKDSSRELVKDLVKIDENFALLLNGMTPDVPAPAPGPRPSPPPRTDLKYDPTYVKLLGQRHEFEIAPGRHRTIECDTDAMDDFLTRADNRGNLFFNEDELAEKFGYNFKLTNGRLFISVSAIAPVNIGDEYKFKFLLESESMSAPVQTNEITLKIVPRITQPPPPPPPPPSPPTPPRRGLPLHVLITKDGREIDGEKSKTWEWACEKCRDFGVNDGGYVYDGGDDGKIYWINYDNNSFQNCFRSQNNEAAKKAVSEKYILGMRILMLGFEHALGDVSNEIKEAMRENAFEEEFRRMAAKGAALVVMTLCDHLPKSFDAYMGRDEADES